MIQNIEDKFLEDFTKSTSTKSSENFQVKKGKSFLSEIEKELTEEKSRTVAITFHAPEWLADVIEKHAKKVGQTRSKLVTKVLEKIYE